MQRGAMITRSLNAALQVALNPNPAARAERFGSVFLPGDKAMVVENDYGREVFNGDLGIMSAIDEEDGSARRATRLLTPAHVLADPDTCWESVIVPRWYGAGERAIVVASATALWRHSGLSVVPIRWVRVRDPEHRFAAPTAVHRPDA